MHIQETFGEFLKGKTWRKIPWKNRASSHLLTVSLPDLCARPSTGPAPPDLCPRPSKGPALPILCGRPSKSPSLPILCGRPSKSLALSSWRSSQFHTSFGCRMVSSSPRSRIQSRQWRQRWHTLKRKDCSTRTRPVEEGIRASEDVRLQH